MRDTSVKEPGSSNKLVSVICRTTNRKELADALDSVARQTYRPLEIILVDANGSGLDQPARIADDIPVKQVSIGKPLSRPAAANAGIEKSNGHFLMFLDDDDWVAPSHIENLVSLLDSQNECQAAYSSTQKTDTQGADTGISFRIPYDPVRLMQDNYIPIHAVVFEKSLTDAGCRFDESLDIFEDWDFWLQVSQATDFLHLDEMTAFYREGGDSETSATNPGIRFEPGSAIANARELLFSKWLGKWSGGQLNALLGSLDMRDKLDTLDARLVQINKNLVQSNQELQLTSKALHQARNKLANLTSELEQTRYHSAKHIDELEAALADLHNSFSWKITRPYRFLRRKSDKYLFGPLSVAFKKIVKVAVSPFPALESKLTEAVSRRTLQKQVTESGSNIHFAFDSLNSICHENLNLKGWAVCADGEISITVLIDSLEYLTFSPTLQRQDVARIFPANPRAPDSGFDQMVSLENLSSGQHTLQLVLSTASGITEQVQRSFYLFHGNELYNARQNILTPGAPELQNLAKSLDRLTEPKTIHVILTSPGDKSGLTSTVASLVEQCTGDWVCHAVDLGWKEISNGLTSKESGDLQNKVSHHQDLASALASIGNSNGYFVCLDAGAVLAPQALAELVSLAISTEVELVYSDHDEIDSNGEHGNPCFTFGWSPEQLYSRNYIGDVYLAKTSLLEKLGTCDFGGAWQYQLLLALSDTTKKIDRVAQVLWSRLPNSSQSGNETEAQESHALQQFFDNKGLQAQVKHRVLSRLVDWKLDSNPSVSIIIPTMGKLDLLKPCIESLISKTAYRDFEVIILDNSRGKNPEGIAYLRDKKFSIIQCDEDFNWARLNNTGARSASGDLLLFLNDDIEVIEEDWLEELVKQASRDSIGAVGGLLLYPNGAIQHAGVFLVNYGGGCAHLFHKMMPGQNIYLRLDNVAREVSANTGACLMVSKDKFEATGGFDEELAVVGNDIDLCLRLIEQGYRNIWTPACKLIHHESISRQASVPRKDELAMWKRWGKRFEQGDWYFNPNLSLASVDCALNLDSVHDKLVHDYCPSLPSSTAIDPALLVPGVNLIAYIRAEMGLGEAARSDARALAAAEVEFGIINFETGNPSRMTDLSWQHKEFSNPIYDINLIHINADHMSFVMNELPNYFFENRYNIGYWAWELSEIPDEWLTAFHYLDEVWVPSNFVKKAVEAKSPVPVIRIPHCIEIQPAGDASRTDFGLPEQPFIFLSMFDTRSVAERKNPYGSIEAFKKAFSPDEEGVCLALKVNNPTATEMEKLQEVTASYHNIVILEQLHRRPEISTLLSLVDCYVSLHRSEGFGLPPAEAMSLGKAVIITNWSGSTDYTTDDNCLPIDYSLIELEEDFGPYKAGQFWAEPDIDAAASAMRRLITDKDLATQLGDNASRTIAEYFSPAAVGKLIKARLDQIRNLRSGS